MSLRDEVLKEMRNPELFIRDVKKYVEENVEDAFNFCCRKNLSINEKYSDAKFQGHVNQKTVFLTVRMFDLWENAVVEVLKDKLSKKFPTIQVIPINDPIGDLMILFPKSEEMPMGEEMRWEIKSSQASSSFTGATHSASKCNNYILINYELNKDLKLKQNVRNNGFVGRLAVFVWDNMEAKWIGNPTKNNSFTTLKIPVEAYAKRQEIIVLGKLKPKRKWCQIVRECESDYGKLNKLF